MLFSPDQGGLPRLYVIRHHHPLPKLLAEKEKPKSCVNDRLHCMCHDSKPGLLYLFKTILVSLLAPYSYPICPCVAAECVFVRVDGWQE